MEFYHGNPQDPSWLARISEFHGHLGPWLVVGALVGRDALQRLKTPGHWKINVVCWIPSDRQRTPFSCMLDGLQASCGATTGKRNLWVRNSAEVLADGWPVVHVMRLPEKDRPLEGITYAAKNSLHDWMKHVTDERIEEASRQLARAEVAELIAISPMGQREFAWCGHDEGRLGEGETT